MQPSIVVANDPSSGCPLELSSLPSRRSSSPRITHTVNERENGFPGDFVDRDSSPHPHLVPRSPSPDILVVPHEPRLLSSSKRGHTCLHQQQGVLSFSPSCISCMIYRQADSVPQKQSKLGISPEARDDRKRGRRRRGVQTQVWKSSSPTSAKRRSLCMMRSLRSHREYARLLLIRFASLFVLSRLEKRTSGTDCLLPHVRRLMLA